MEKLKNNISASHSLLWQLLILMIQFAMYLSFSWLNAYSDQPLSVSWLDRLFWSVLIPMTWPAYALVSYHYSHNIILAIAKGLLQTIVSYAFVIGSSLAFYTWIW